MLLDYLSELKLITRVPISKKGKRQSTQVNVIGKRGHGPRNINNLQMLEKVRKQILPWSLRKNAACQHFDLHPRRPISDF